MSTQSLLRGLIRDTVREKESGKSDDVISLLTTLKDSGADLKSMIQVGVEGDATIIKQLIRLRERLDSKVSLAEGKKLSDSLKGLGIDLYNPA